RFDCRKQIVEDLKALNLVEKIEDYDNKVGYSERTNVPIEPRLSLQWFVKMQHFADIALPPVMNDEIVFYPTKYKNTYRNWLENIKDWCISRQLWWGHRIPAYYDADLLAETGLENYPDDKIIVSETKPEGNYVQDEGALDTWFSSWLWPISLFDGIENPGNKEINYYYPTADLVTGPDIIFFWVARMIMAGYEYVGKMPFKHVYFTGIVRDKLGRKMSKSLGNSPDPLDLIERFGADGVRMGILLSAPAGNDILYDDSLCEQGRNFCNKIWNCFRLIKGFEVSNDQQPTTNDYAIRWFDAKLRQTELEIADLFSKYRLSEALMTIFRLYCDEFSGWYLEMIKPAYQQPIDRATYEATLAFFDKMLKLLHPFMPFITEELWQNLYERKEGESIMSASLNDGMSATASLNDAILADVEELKLIIAGVRNIRASKNIPPKEVLTLISPVELNPLVAKLANVKVSYSDSGLTAQRSNNETVQQSEGRSGSSATFIVGTTEFAIPMDKFINVDEELKKLEADLQHQQGFLRGVMAKLGNERFVANAKPEIVELERKKKADAEARIAALEEAIRALKG
ncbi:MAG: class I tRNA ligase family protein, partial [Paludibacteraceae bacterium]|nr:class I tRNA ligase family protein [Paludibacteraceae bacterium]